MRYHVLACDYDGTVAHHGRIDDETVAALGRLRDTGRRLILVTGREVQDVLAVCPHVGLFDRVVAENGAVVYCPATRAEKLLAEPPPEPFVRALRERGVSPIAVGRVIVATWKPHETTVLEVIRDLGLELHVTFNKDAVMVLPAGLSKATGLAEALRELNLSAHNVVGVGDAENDHAFLRLCECRVAVANAVPMLKDGADLVTRGDEGAGVCELIERLLAVDLRDLEPRLARHAILLGARADRTEVLLQPHGTSVLLAGSSGSGKSTLVAGFSNASRSVSTSCASSIRKATIPSSRDRSCSAIPNASQVSPKCSTCSRSLGGTWSSTCSASSSSDGLRSSNRSYRSSRSSERPPAGRTGSLLTRPTICCRPPGMPPR